MFQAQFPRARLDRADLTGARIIGSFEGGSLEGARLTGVDGAPDMRNQSMGMTRVSFRSARMQGADLERRQARLGRPGVRQAAGRQSRRRRPYPRPSRRRQPHRRQSHRLRSHSRRPRIGGPLGRHRSERRDRPRPSLQSGSGLSRQMSAGVRSPPAHHSARPQARRVRLLWSGGDRSPATNGIALRPAAGCDARADRARPSARIRRCCPGCRPCPPQRSRRRRHRGPAG